jgi:hypothetical protein
MRTQTILQKNLIILLLTLFTSNSFSQVNHIKILLGETDQQVVHYFDSLGTHDNVYKITRGVTTDGLLTLVCEFNLLDEKYYSCNAVFTMFIRKDGIEFCVKQKITGTTEFAFTNLDYIKDNFKFISDRKWEKDSPLKGFKYVATFNADSTDSKFYSIDYNIEKEK